MQNQIVMHEKHRLQLLRDDFDMWDEIQWAQGYSLALLADFFRMPNQLVSRAINLFKSIYTPGRPIFDTPCDVCLGLFFDWVARNNRGGEIDTKHWEAFLRKLQRSNTDVGNRRKSRARYALRCAYYSWRSVANLQNLSDIDFKSVYESYPANLLEDPETPWEKLLVKESRRSERLLRVLDYEINTIQSKVLTKDFLFNFSLVPFSQQAKFIRFKYFDYDNLSAEEPDDPILQVRFASALLFKIIFRCSQNNFNFRFAAFTALMKT